MNIVLVDPTELAADGIVRLDGRRADHIREVLGKGIGDPLRLGVLRGNLGEGVIRSLDGGVVEVQCRFEEAPPAKSMVDLVLALPRPPVLRRVLQHVTALGVPRIALLHTRRVEKSYWSSPALQPAAIDEQLGLGLEQAVDTVPPTVEQFRKFRPFVEDVLARSDRQVLVAHPGAEAPCPTDVAVPTTVVVGPEGGFVPFELERLEAIGARRVGLGPRTLRVETAVVALLGRLLRL